MVVARMKLLVLGLVAVSACGGGSQSSGSAEPSRSVARDDAGGAPDEDGAGVGPPPHDDGGSVGNDAAGPVDAGDDAFSMKTWKPPAKGLWIWYFDYVGMTAAQAAAKAQ